MKGREVEEFSCKIMFQQEGHDEHAIYVNPGFSLVKVILYVVGTILFRIKPVRQVTVFFEKPRKKKVKLTRKYKTQNQTKSDVAFGSTFSY